MPHPTPPTVRKLHPDDAEAFIELRRQALDHEPFAFAASREDDRALAPGFVRTSLAERTEQAVFGAFLPELVGVVGVHRMRLRKMRHKAQIWGMYVDPDHRRAGVGGALLRAAVAFARSLDGVLQLHLTVSENANPARQLYERHGFRRWGTEPRALLAEGRLAADHHMVLRLDG